MLLYTYTCQNCQKHFTTHEKSSQCLFCESYSIKSHENTAKEESRVKQFLDYVNDYFNKKYISLSQLQQEYNIKSKYIELTINDDFLWEKVQNISSLNELLVFLGLNDEY